MQLLQCHYCGSPVTHGFFKYCTVCGKLLNWSKQKLSPAYQQQGKSVRRPPGVKPLYNQQYGYNQQPPKKKGISRWLLGCIISVCVICLAGVIVAIPKDDLVNLPFYPKVALTVPELPLTTSEQLYIARITNNSSQVRTTLAEIGGLLRQMLRGNDEWVKQWINANSSALLNRLTKTKSLYNKAIKLEAPDSLSGIHDKYLQSMTHYDNATQLITEGMDTFNIDMLHEAEIEIKTCTQLIKEANKLIDEFLETRSD